MKMNYVAVGTNDLDAATGFYDALFEGTGVTQVMKGDRMTYWMGADFAFAAALPFDGCPATNGNGTMVGFCVGPAEQVRALHAKAIALGGRCEGEPNQRGPKFSAYVRDLDRNKLCFSD